MRKPSSIMLSASRLDRLDQVVLSMFYAFLVVRILLPLDHRGFALLLLGNLPLLVSEGLVLVLTLLRRPAQSITSSPVDWMLALGASILPLLVAPVSEGKTLLPTQLFIVWMLLALGFQIFAKLALGRSFGLVAANRGLRLTGLYQLVRHPIYLGYLLMHVCFALRNPSLRNFFLYAGFYSLQLPRIAAEERVLMRDPDYRAYASQVRWRLLPWIY